MKYLAISIMFFSLPLFSQGTKRKNVHWMQCKMQRGTKSQVKNFTVHKKYDLFVNFNSMYASIMADHQGIAGAKGKGFRWTIYVRDSKIGGMVQGKSSPVLRGPWWRHDVMVEDKKNQVRIWCKMK
ncbi:MAG: hypothetical protein E2O68_03890 [Deltaproteobacteria bacterium]|nr:MAG: hypothetical protein E2O68_03890 [Deltaproteobacteria bacterium]